MAEHPYVMQHVVAMRTPFKIFNTIVRSIAIFMIDTLKIVWIWNKCRRNQTMYFYIKRFPITIERHFLVVSLSSAMTISAVSLTKNPVLYQLSKSRAALYTSHAATRRNHVLASHVTTVVHNPSPLFIHKILAPDVFCFTQLTTSGVVLQN